MDSRIPIPLMGINHNIPDQEVPDGNFFELINLRHKDQVLRPVPLKVRGSCPQAKILFKHQINVDTFAYLGVYTSGQNRYIAYYIYTSNVLVASSTTAWQVQNDWDLAFADLGLTVMVTDRTANETVLFVYRTTPTPSYFVLTETVPELYSPSFRATIEATRNKTNTSPDLPVSDVGSYDTAKLAEYVKVIEEGLSKGTLVGKYLVRIAFELFDGRIVRPSIPELVQAAVVNTQTFVKGTDWITWTTVLDGRDLEMNLNMDSNHINYLQTYWKEFIRAVNIYITDTWKPGETTWKNYNIDPNSRRFGGGTNRRIPGSAATTAEINPILEYEGRDAGGQWRRGAYLIPDWNPDLHESAYFLLKSIELKDLTTGWITLTDKTDPLTDLIFRANMPVDENTHHKISGDILFSYNDRYWLGNISTRLYKGFPLTGIVNQIAGTSPVTTYDLGVEYDIQTIQGIRTVFSGWFAYTYGNTGYECQFTMKWPGTSPAWFQKYWGYPDARAKTARIVIRQSGTTRLLATCQMEAVREMNFSRVIDNFTTGTVYGAVTISALSPYTLLTDQDRYVDNNRIQACEFQNPFFFPAVNSYNLEGEVRGLATNAVAVSQGQFGQFPVYAFTSRGIWALNIGNGSVLVSAMSPVSRYVLSNKNSILMIDGGVLFVTAEGLMILSGAEPVQEIGEPLERGVVSPLAEINDYQDAVNNPNIYQALPYFDATDFLTYLQGAILAYDPLEAEIIVSNSTYQYSYVFSLVSKLWHKISQSWIAFIADYPRWLGLVYVNATYYLDNLSQEEPDGTVPIMVHAETRAIKFGEPMSRKQLKRFLLVSTINRAPEQVFAFYLFGSPEMNEYYMQIASTNVVPGENTIIGRSSFSCKAFIITFGGWVLKTSSIGTLVADVEKRYQDKLR